MVVVSTLTQISQSHSSATVRRAGKEPSVISLLALITATTKESVSSPVMVAVSATATWVGKEKAAPIAQPMWDAF